MEQETVPKGQCEGSHQVLVIWNTRKNRVGDEIPPELQVIVYLGSSPGEEEQVAFIDFLRSLKTFRDLTRD